MVKDFIKIVTAILMSCLLLTTDSYAAMPSGALRNKFDDFLRKLASSGLKDDVKEARKIIVEMKRFNLGTAARLERELAHIVGDEDTQKLIQVLTDQVSMLQAQLAEKTQRGEGEARQAETQNQQLRTELDRLRCELAQRDDSVRRLQAALRGAQDEARGKIAQLERAAAVAATAHERCEEVRQRQDARNTELEQHLCAAQEERDAFRTQLDTVLEQLRGAVEEFGDK